MMFEPKKATIRHMAGGGGSGYDSYSYGLGLNHW